MRDFLPTARILLVLALTDACLKKDRSFVYDLPSHDSYANGYCPAAAEHPRHVDLEDVALLPEQPHSIGCLSKNGPRTPRNHSITLTTPGSTRRKS